MFINTSIKTESNHAVLYIQRLAFLVPCWPSIQVATAKSVARKTKVQMARFSEPSRRVIGWDLRMPHIRTFPIFVK